MNKKLIAGFLITALTLGMLAATGQALASSNAGAVIEQSHISSTRQKVIRSGLNYLGTPYLFGSSRSNTNTFDCSDFVRQAYNEGATLILPSNSRTQGAYVKDNGGVTTDWQKLKPGDIMFFMSYKGSDKSYYKKINKSKQRITHNGIYLGNGKILHTYSKKSGGVRIDSIENTQWENRFLFGGSILK